MLAAAQEGAAWALARLYEDLAPAVAGYLRVQGADHPEDLTSDVFVGVVSGIGRFQGDEAGFRSWVFTIAHHRVLDERRRRARRPSARPLDDAEPHPAGDAEAQAIDQLAAEGVVRLLHGLSPDQRDVLYLRIVGDLTVEQVARAVGKRPGAVKALQRRALEALRKKLSREGVPL